jgi:hypothetical protein
MRLARRSHETRVHRILGVLRTLSIGAMHAEGRRSPHGFQRYLLNRGPGSIDEPLTAYRSKGGAGIRMKAVGPILNFEGPLDGFIDGAID